MPDAWLQRAAGVLNVAANEVEKAGGEGANEAVAVVAAAAGGSAVGDSVDNASAAVGGSAAMSVFGAGDSTRASGSAAGVSATSSVTVDVSVLLDLIQELGARAEREAVRSETGVGTEL